MQDLKSYFHYHHLPISLSRSGSDLQSLISALSRSLATLNIQSAVWMYEGTEYDLVLTSNLTVFSLMVTVFPLNKYVEIH